MPSASLYVTRVGTLPFPEKWGEQIRTLRELRGLTARDLAAELDVTEVSLRRWETGTRSPSDLHKIRIASFFNVDPNMLFPLPCEKWEEAS